jgi:hypothetical protein
MNTFAEVVRAAVVCLLVLLVFSPLLAPLFVSQALGKLFVIVLQTLPLTTLGFIFFVFDSDMAVSRSWIICGFFLAAGIGISIFVSRRLNSRFGWGLGALLVATVLIISIADLSPVKPYRRFFAAIQDGMSRSDVMAALHRQFPDGGRFPVPRLALEQTDQLSFILDRTQGAYDAEIVLLRLNDGKVVSKSYLPD